MSYKVQKMFQWYDQFDKEDIKIEGETKEFTIELTNKTLPHLLGLQYINKNKNIMKGYRLKQYIQKENLSDEQILKRVKNNNPNQLTDVKNRIDTLQEFLENIEEGYIVEQTNPKTQIKSNYLVVQSKGNTILHLGIRSSEIGDNIESFEVFPKKDSYLETYIVQNNFNYFENSTILEGIKGIYRYNEITEEFEPFTFRGKQIQWKQKFQRTYKKEEEKEENMEENKKYGIVNNKENGQKIMQQIMEEAKVSKPPKYKEEREKFTESVIKSLEEGKIPWERDWESTASILHNPVSQTKYQGKNGFKLAVISFKKNYKDPRWVTFKQAQKAEWKVKKGEKATTIEVYKRYDKQTKKDFDIKTIENMSTSEKNKYLQENVYGFIKTYNVFNAEQLEGIGPFKEEKRNVEYNKINKILQNSKVPVQYLGDKAFYEHTTDSITLPDKANFKNENSFYGTALHELAHSTGHKDRLNRDIDHKFGTKQYAREELVAEFSSVFVGQQLGLNYDKDKLDNSKAYLQNWAKHLKEDKNLLYDAIKDAEIATKSIVAMQTKEGPEIFKQYNQEREIIKGKNQEKNKGIER